MDNPFEASEVRFWSVKTMFNFLFKGLPRLIIVLIFLIILLILLIIFGKNNKAYYLLTQFSTLIIMYIYGYRNITITPETINIIKNSKAQIIVSSHALYMDALVLMNLFPDAKFIASNFVKDIPIINKLFERKGIYITGDFKGNLTDLITEELKKGSKIIFFSAGVCHNPEYVLQFRSGAFVPKMTILPIHIKYNDNEYFINGEHDMCNHILNHISQSRNTYEVRALKEYELSDEEKTGDIEIFKENFRKYYAKGFNLKLSQKTYKDHPYFKLMKKIKDEKN